MSALICASSLSTLSPWSLKRLPKHGETLSLTCSVPDLTKLCGFSSESEPVVTSSDCEEAFLSVVAAMAPPGQAGVSPSAAKTFVSVPGVCLAISRRGTSHEFFILDRSAVVISG